MKEDENFSRHAEGSRPLRVLFVCTGNVDRSRTAQEMYEGIEGLEVRSAGTSIAAVVPLTRELIRWADKIFVMEPKHQRAVLRMDASAEKRTICLGIPDEYYHGQRELKLLLAEKLQPYLKFKPKI